MPRFYRGRAGRVAAPGACSACTLRGMDLVDERRSTLADELRALAARGGLSCACVRSVHHHAIKSFEPATPVIALPLAGTKRARLGEQRVEVRPGELFVITGPASLDVENIPEPASGEYLALGVALDERVIGAAQRLLPERARDPAPRIAGLPIGALATPLLDWTRALERRDEALARHALVGVVLRLHELGLEGIVARRTPRLAAQIRERVAADPTRPWASSHLEELLGMSGATLRRRLAAEGESLREVIAHARLAHALELLYTTRLPVKAVAQRSGYASAASFARRFEERYGIEPSRVGSA